MMGSSGSPECLMTMKSPKFAAKISWMEFSFDCFAVCSHENVRVFRCARAALPWGVRNNLRTPAGLGGLQMVPRALAQQSTKVPPRLTKSI